MTNPTLQMLLERLLWPVPRVRWEVARSLARLIREGDREAASGLLNWISARQLESEVVIGLGIIDAFDLGAYFEFDEVSKAIQAPSHLSDYLLKRNFANTSGLSPSRYAVSPSDPVTLPQHEQAWFNLYCKSAVAPMFLSALTQLQESTGQSFRIRWEHDWRWLQATHPRPEAKYPHFFSDGNRDRAGQFDLGQRELYVSAYLRTLAYYAITRAISPENAERYAMLALTMNREMADLEPIDRPDWAQNLLPCDARRLKELAENIWVSVEATAKPGEVPLAVRVVDFHKEGFIEFDSTLTIGPPGFTTGPAEAEEFKELIAKECPGEMTGLVGWNAGIDPLHIVRPLAMTQSVLQDFIGRVHIDIASEIRLASPYVFGTSANVQCGPTEIRLEVEGDVLSRWVHWYADWEPTIFTELRSAVGSMTMVLKSSLDKVCASPGVEVARLMRVRRGVRPEVYLKPEVETDAYWM